MRHTSSPVGLGQIQQVQYVRLTQRFLVPKGVRFNVEKTDAVCLIDVRGHFLGSPFDNECDYCYQCVETMGERRSSFAVQETGLQIELCCFALALLSMYAPLCGITTALVQS